MRKPHDANSSLPAPIPRFAAFVLTLCLLLPLFVLPMQAADSSGSSDAGTEEITVFPDADGRLVDSLLDYPLDSFDNSKQTWQSETEGVTLSTAARTDEPPYRAFAGSGSLCVTGKADPPLNHIYLSRDPDSDAPFSASGARYFVLAFGASAPGTGYYRLLLTLTFADNSTASFSQRVNQGGWNAVFFDLSSCADRLSSIRSFKLRVSRSRADSDVMFFCLDSMGFSSVPSAQKAMNLLGASYTLSQGSLTEQGGTLSLSLGGKDPYLETSSLPFRDFTGRSLSVSLVNETDCEQIMLYYQTESDPVFSERKVVTAGLNASRGVQTLIFSLPDEPILSFRLVFCGAPKGHVSIESVSTAVSYTLPDRPAQIRTCEVSPDRDDIVVKGSLNAGNLDKFRGASILLYPLLPCQSINEVMDGGRSAVASGILSGTEFTLTYKDGVEKNGVSRLYAVAFLSGGSETVAANPVSVTNPERLADPVSSPLPITVSKKGIAPESSIVRGDGSAYTSVTLNLAELLSDKTTDPWLSLDGTVYHFSSSVLSSLDQTMTRCAQRGVGVFLTLTLAAKERTGPAAALIHPDADLSASSLALNTATPEGCQALSAVFSFLADRYAGDGMPLSGVILGENIGSGADAYNMGSPDLTGLCTACADALRLAYTAFRSVNASLSVSLSLGCEWNRVSAPDSCGGGFMTFGTKQILSLLRQILSAGGDIEWSLAYDPVPSGPVYSAYADDTLLSGADSPRVTFGNLEVLTDFISRSPFLYNGNARQIILLEHQAPEITSEEEQNRMLADYAYSCYRVQTASMARVTAYIANRGSTLLPLYREIDTEKTLDVTAFALPLLGVTEWQLAVPGFDHDKAALRSELDTAFYSEPLTGITGSARLFSFGEQPEGTVFQPLSDAVTLSFGVSLGEEEDLLHLRLGQKEAGTERGIYLGFDCPYDLSSAPYLTFNAQIAVLPEGITEVTLRILLQSGTSFARYSGSLRAGDFHTIQLDLRPLAGAKGIDRMWILIDSPSGIPLGEPTLLLSSPKLLSRTATDAQIEKQLDAARHPDTETASVNPRLIAAGVIAAVLIAALIWEAIRIRKRIRLPQPEETGLSPFLSPFDSLNFLNHDRKR